jgi:iron complex transport system ATP-binding protein
MPSDSLALDGVCFSYADDYVIKEVSLTVGRGEMVGLLGPNGSGKSTLLKLASGILQPQEGDIFLEGRPLRTLPRRQIAQAVSVVLQQLHIPFAFNVEEVVSLGRTPFLNSWLGGRDPNRDRVQWAMEAMTIAGRAGRIFNDLSGGEQRKVIIAMALAQEPHLLLLDEPVAHLDIRHQVEILDLVKGLNREEGLTVVAAMHDLNLAALYFPRLVLIKEGEVVSDSSPQDVLTRENISDVFSASVLVRDHPTLPAPQVVLVPKDSSGPGHDVL